MVNAQQWLDRKYPKATRKQVTCVQNDDDVEIGQKSEEKLEGYLDLRDFVNIDRIYLVDNQITDIDLSKCNQLEELNLSNNLLTSTDFLRKLPHPEKLTMLVISNNNFSRQKLDFLIHFTPNLWSVWVGNTNKQKVQQGIYNRFYGSLEPLRKFTKLAWLEISNTDIDSGLEHLTLDRLSVFYYSPALRPDCEVNKIYNLLGQEWDEDGMISEKVRNILKEIKQKSNKKEVLSNVPESEYKHNTELLEKKANWKENNYPFKNFTEKLTQEWINAGFDKKGTREWLESGLQPSDADYAKRLKNSNKDAEWFLEYGSENLKINAQQWLDQWYPKNGVCQLKKYKNRWEKEYDNENYGKTRKEITKLDISNQNLHGSLKLTNFSNLQEFDCSNNQLTTLNLTNCPQLKEIECGFNQLSDLVLPVNNQVESLWCPCNQLTSLPDNLNPLSLIVLSLRDNYLHSDLTIFSHLVNLEKLYIGQNQFTGSLVPLTNLTKLRELHVLGTQVDSGLEYLPEDLERFYCGGTKLFNILAPSYMNPGYGAPWLGIPGKDGYYDLSKWKKDNQELVNKARSHLEKSQLETKSKTTSSSKKNKNAKLREAKEQIVQLQAELEVERSKNVELEKKVKELQEKLNVLQIDETQAQIQIPPKY